MLKDAFVVAVVGGTLCLDRVAVQLMISRPIVIAPLVALILGDVATGLFIGAVVEMLWSDRPPMGNYVPPNDSLTALVMTAAAVLASPLAVPVSKSLISLSIIMLYPIGYLSQRLELKLMRANDDLSMAALADAEKGRIEGVQRRHLMGLFRYWMLFQSFLFVGVLAATPALRMIHNRLSPAGERAMEILYLFIPVVALVCLFNAVRSRCDVPLFSAAFFVTVVIIDVLLR